VSALMADVKAKNPGEPEFHQAVQEVVESLALVLDQHPEYRKAKIIERIIEPERAIIFRVLWQDDNGELHVNRGFRIQMDGEIGFLFGMYKRLKNEFTGVITGKGLMWGGSVIRPEATGYGAVYFAAEMLKTRKEDLKGKTCLVSGGGNVAQYTVDKLISLGGK